MNDFYDIDSVVIGKIYICKQYGGRIGFVENKTTEYYLFYKNDNRGKKLFSGLQKLIEVFTEDEFEIYNGDANTNNHIFNKPYIVDVQSIIPYLTEQEKLNKVISKYRIIEIYNTINFKEKEKQKTKQTIA